MELHPGQVKSSSAGGVFFKNLFIIVPPPKNLIYVVVVVVVLLLLCVCSALIQLCKPAQTKLRSPNAAMWNLAVDDKVQQVHSAAGSTSA